MIEFLNKLVSISGATTSQGSNFGFTVTNSTVYSNVPASVQPATSSIMKFYGERQIRVTNTVFVNQQLTLARGDVVTYGTTSYRVEGWRDLSGAGLCLAIDCSEFKS